MRGEMQGRKEGRQRDENTYRCTEMAQMATVLVDNSLTVYVQRGAAPLPPDLAHAVENLVFYALDIQDPLKQLEELLAIGARPSVPTTGTEDTPPCTEPTPSRTGPVLNEFSECATPRLQLSTIDIQLLIGVHDVFRSENLENGL